MFISLSKKFKQDQQGSLFPFFIVFFTVACIAYFVFLDSYVRENQVNELVYTVSIAAELRANEINNPLKEVFGIIEAIPTEQTGRDNYEASLSIPEGYDYVLTDINSPAIVNYTKQLNDAIKATIVRETASNSNNTITVDPANICVKTITLPIGLGKKMDISCTFNGEVYTENILVDGLDHPANLTDDLQVTNAVFIMAIFDAELTFKGLPSLLPNITSLEDGKVEIIRASISYPIIEKQTRN